MDRTIRVNGLAFRCRVEGREGAPWMVFSNSLLTELAMWDAQAAHFAPRYRLLRYDQRGHGGTEVPGAATDLGELTEDAAALMREAGAASAVFVGVSMGAATGFALAARHPELVSALVAADGQAATAPGGGQAWQERIDMAAAEGMDAFAEATLKRWFSPASLAAGNPAIGRVRAMIRATPMAGFAACARALQSYDVREGLPGIAQPTLLLAGEADGAMPQTMRGLAAVLPDARFEAIAGAGHLPPIEAPGAFNAAMDAFLIRA